MVPGSSQDQLYQYALSVKHWKAGNLRLELLCEEGVDVAFGESSPKRRVLVMTKEQRSIMKKKTEQSTL